MDNIRELLKAATVLNEVANSPTCDAGTSDTCLRASRILRKMHRELTEHLQAASYGYRAPAVVRVLKSQQ